MPLSRNEKEKLVSEYQQGLGAAPHAFLLGFKGITVPQVTELRNRVRRSGGSYLVVKNNLALRAIDSSALGALKEHFIGPTAVVYCDKDPVALAKALTDFAKETPTIEFKAGMVERRAVAAGQIKEIAQLPSRDQLVAKLLFLLQSPIIRLARVLNALPQSLTAVLDQVRRQRETSAEASSSAAEEPAEAGSIRETPAEAGSIRTETPAEAGSIRTETPAEAGSIPAEEPAEAGSIPAEEPAEAGSIPEEAAGEASPPAVET
ncbi:MAG TPA: 50S ribosomal protein L10 [Thermoanaerobaculia bacterium]|nr:50S ribosomal protein L10 [Thermoanaerobaculia bacterium]